MNSVIGGRMNRSTYWLLLGAVAVIYGLLLAFAKKPPAVAELVMIVLGVPRLHDIGRSGWWIASPIGFEVVAVAIAFLVLGTMEGVLAVSGLVLIAIVIAMMILGCIPGQPFSNSYGEVPPRGLSFVRVPA